jgi:hypothetical protein
MAGHDAAYRKGDVMKEKIVKWIAWRLPRSVAYWAFVRCSVSNSDGSNYPFNPDKRFTGDVLKNLGSWAK